MRHGLATAMPASPRRPAGPAGPAAGPARGLVSAPTATLLGRDRSPLRRPPPEGPLALRETVIEWDRCDDDTDEGDDAEDDADDLVGGEAVAAAV